MQRTTYGKMCKVYFKLVQIGYNRNLSVCLCDCLILFFMEDYALINVLTKKNLFFRNEAKQQSDI